ncbi:hypothetical protein GUITHDRAFT_145491 [Guillardia theta CCMP2712]|uniref:Right handed beta helix domain-containing protein n=1 Tax=Guillardia theta (strain CCMP2712) TaxID=905079 RepID=L1ILS1_GUITC|nr:hypothetical protein GUITHDRAFT_145491 [Guillardia theta CCMP2712]EKX36745.1 hypothetical protein GUITHDRAFT_145491 [Guillardia theta CCMP2712]|eukprot:XP_005823725.1 hypothetical protein GUITHDRAFT_145491 [Guillardia theta CCMP2712]
MAGRGWALALLVWVCHVGDHVVINSQENSKPVSMLLRAAKEQGWRRWLPGDVGSRLWRRCGCGGMRSGRMHERGLGALELAVMLRHRRAGEMLRLRALRGGLTDGDDKYVPGMMQDLSDDSQAEGSARYARPQLDSLSVQDATEFYMNLTRMAAKGEKIPEVSSLMSPKLVERHRALDSRASLDAEHFFGLEETDKQKDSQGVKSQSMKSQVERESTRAESMTALDKEWWEMEGEMEEKWDELARSLVEFCCNEEIRYEDVQEQQQGLLGYFPCMFNESNFSLAVAGSHTSGEVKRLLQKQVSRHVLLKNPPDNHVREYDVIKGKGSLVAYDMLSAISAAFNCTRTEYMESVFTEHGTHGNIDVEDGLHEIETQLALIPIGFTLSVKGVSDSAVVNGSWDLQDQALEDACLSIWGGPWTIDEELIPSFKCKVITISASAIKLFRLGAAWVSDCTIGGEGMDMFELAGDGVTVSLGARLIMERTSVFHTGLLGGIGVRAEDKGYVTLKDCLFRDNVYAVGVTCKAKMQVLNCKLLQQQSAAIWIGAENQTYLEIRNSTIRGVVFEDIVFENRNETVRQQRRKEYSFLGTPVMFDFFPPDNDQNLPESERLYHAVGYYILRPSVFINESNEFLSHSGLKGEEEDLPAWANHPLDNFVSDSEGNLYFEPDVSDEDDLYCAAIEDARMESDGKQPLEYELAGGLRVRGKLNYTAARLKSEQEKYVSTQTLQRIRKWVDLYMAHLKELERRRQGPDPIFDPDNVYKRELWAWGHIRTEWDHLVKDRTEDDKKIMSRTLEENLYPKLPDPDDSPLLLDTDLDQNTRSTLCPIPIPRDRKLLQKVERKMGLPLHPQEPRGKAAYHRWLNQVCLQEVHMSFDELLKRDGESNPIEEDFNTSKTAAGDGTVAGKDTMEGAGGEEEMDIDREWSSKVKEESSFDPDWKPKPVRRKSTMR